MHNIDNGMFRTYLYVYLLLRSMSCVVDLNDSLYGGDRKYVAELSKVAETLITEVLEHLKSLATGNEVSPQIVLRCFVLSIMMFSVEPEKTVCSCTGILQQVAIEIAR